MKEIFENARKAGKMLAPAGDQARSAVLVALSDRLSTESSSIIAANRLDLSRMDKDNPLYDRLLLTEERLEGIASDIKKVASLPDPVGRVLDERELPNGLHLRKVAVPFGVIGVIYEARPNVTFDVFSLCFKSGNACVLKGGGDAENTNAAAIGLIRSTLAGCGFNPDSAVLLPSTHEAVSELMNADGYVDLVIPRGGRKLIDFVRNNCKVPYIATGAGVVHVYFDRDGSLATGRSVVNNAKTRRVSVCNALDCLLADRKALGCLAALCEPLAASGVEVYCDEESYSELDGIYPADLLKHAGPDTYGTEFLSYRMAVKIVDGVDGAVEHINRYGSGHSECIVTENAATAALFQRDVDAACVYVNASTAFTDGGQFGMGAEIGISTQKLGARGPMALPELTTYKWLINGNGQIRK